MPICSFAWIFFVSDSMGDAWYVITHLFTGICDTSSYFQNSLTDMGLTNGKLAVISFCLIFLTVFDTINLKTDCIELISKKNVFVRYFFYMLLLFLILFLRASAQVEFVYFQF